MLDEPTNDLDIETLDLLQELLADYDGTALIVSHDRDFIDRVATSVIALEGDGAAVEYPGGWTDYYNQRPGRAKAPAKTPEGKAPKPAAKSAPAPVEKPARQSGKMSFRETHRLATLPAEMDRLSGEITKLESFLADPELFTREPKKFKKATEALTERQEALAAAEEEWLELEARREELEG